TQRHCMPAIAPGILCVTSRRTVSLRGSAPGWVYTHRLHGNPPHLTGNHITSSGGCPCNDERVVPSSGCRIPSPGRPKGRPYHPHHPIQRPHHPNKKRAEGIIPSARRDACIRSCGLRFVLWRGTRRRSRSRAHPLRGRHIQLMSRYPAQACRYYPPR
ncbi:MAG: hypothetical protein RI985_1216, partial [Chloroflexota bacterium]